ncbi:unnamed protein product [Effrenium voratum]|uniref:EamA domain-containing protein n=1 Tax=Effrenium voratum TaxID=2562239 RepID=A0AA36HT87_9DINO|nr:unnamed protein product [Effrenium voratum]
MDWPAFVPVTGSTGTATSSSRPLRRRAKTPWRPEEPAGLAPLRFVAGASAAAAVLRRRPVLQAEAKVKEAKVATKSWLRAPPPWAVALLGFAMVLLHRVALKEFKSAGAAMPPPRFTVFLHAAIFLIASQVMPPTKFPKEQNVKVILLVGVVELLGWVALQQVATAGSLGVSAALLSGVSLLVTLLAARFLLRSRVKRTAWLGAAIVALGVGAAGPVKALSSLHPGLQQAALLCSALSFSGLALTGKEVLFSGRAPLSVASVACLASCAQLLALALPEILSLKSFPGSLEVAQIIVGPAPRIAALPVAAYIYILGSAVLRLTFTWALRSANAPTVQLVNAVAVPFGSAVLMLLSRAQISGQTLMALGLCTLGSVVFFLREGPLVKTSELFGASLTEEQIKLEEAWKKEKEEQAKKSQEERKQKEEEKRKAQELQAKQRQEREGQLRKEREQKQKQKEDEQKRKEEERQRVAAEKKRLKEEARAIREEEKRKAEEERRKKQEEYEAKKLEEQKQAIAAKKRKEEEKKQKEEEARLQKEAEKEAGAKKKQQEQEAAAVAAQQKQQEEARKKEEKQRKEAEAKAEAEAKKAEAKKAEAKKAEELRAEERRKEEQEEEARLKAEEQAQSEEFRKRREAEARKQQEEEAARKRQEEEVARKRQEEEEARKQQEAERKRQEEEVKRQQEEERKQKELEEQAREEERKRKETEEGERTRQEGKEERIEEEVTAQSGEADEKEKQKRYSRLSFKWKVQDEMRWGQEAARIKQQLMERERELEALRKSKEEDDRRWAELQEEAKQIEAQKAKDGHCRLIEPMVGLLSPSLSLQWRSVGNSSAAL